MSPPSLAHAVYGALHTIGEWETSPIKSTRDLPRDVHMGCTPRQDSITYYARSRVCDSRGDPHAPSALIVRLGSSSAHKFQNVHKESFHLHKGKLTPPNFTPLLGLHTGRPLLPLTLFCQGIGYPHARVVQHWRLCTMYPTNTLGGNDPLATRGLSIRSLATNR
eukprot:scaffold7_cov414-Pavlova_lutheri.AAC.9